MQLIALQWTRMISVNKNNPAIKVIYPVDSVISLSKNSGQEKHQRGSVTVFWVILSTDKITVKLKEIRK